MHAAIAAVCHGAGVHQPPGPHAFHRAHELTPPRYRYAKGHPMIRRTCNFDDFGMATATLAGPLQARLAAIRDAGFTQVMLEAGDVAQYPGGLEAAARAVKASGLRVTGLQWLRDFEGLSEQQHAYKLEVAQALLQMAHAIGAPVLMVSASTHPAAAQDFETIARDLRKLAMLAIPLDLRVAYEAAGGSETVHDLFCAWDVVDRADMPNLGLAIDTADTVLAGLALDDLDLIDPDKIFVVRLADVFDSATAGTGAPRRRVFPGEGPRSVQLAALVRQLAELGFRGAYSFEVFNDDYQQLPLPTVAERARRSATWLAEDILRRSTPLPGQMQLRALKET
jgi:sugar phosphate isomerase/epimerase